MERKSSDGPFGINWAVISKSMLSQGTSKRDDENGVAHTIQEVNVAWQLYGNSV